MACSNKLLDLSLMDIAAEIPIDKCFSYFHFDPFIREYNVYQHICPVVGEKYSCIRVFDNTQDKHAIAIINEERVVVHIPICVLKIREAVFESSRFTFESRSDR